MDVSPPADVTRLLLAWSDGDASAYEQLVPLVYQELRRLAQYYIAQERSEHTLQATALVHEAYMRLIDWKNVRWQSRAHFFGVSAKLMRRILVDHARSHGYLKRGGGALKVALDANTAASIEPDADFLALDEALDRLAVIDPRKSRVVELRFFGGLSVEDTAEVLQVSERTVKREWSLAQAWLYDELRGENPDDS